MKINFSASSLISTIYLLLKDWSLNFLTVRTAMRYNELGLRYDAINAQGQMNFPDDITHFNQPVLKMMLTNRVAPFCWHAQFLSTLLLLSVHSLLSRCSHVKKQHTSPHGALKERADCLFPNDWRTWRRIGWPSPKFCCKLGQGLIHPHFETLIRWETMRVKKYCAPGRWTRTCPVVVPKSWSWFPWQSLSQELWNHGVDLLYDVVFRAQFFLFEMSAGFLFLIRWGSMLPWRHSVSLWQPHIDIGKDKVLHLLFFLPDDCCSEHSASIPGSESSRNISPLNRALQPTKPGTATGSDPARLTQVDKLIYTRWRRSFFSRKETCVQFSKLVRKAL